MGAPRLRPQEALLEQSRTSLAWLQGLPTEAFERPTVLPGWSVRQLAGHLVLVHAGLAQSLDQPTKEVALPIHEFVTRYRRDVEMIMAATLEASAGLTGPEVLARLESAIDDLAARLDAGVEMSRVISTRRGPTTIEDYVATRIVELVIHTDDLNRSLPEVAASGAASKCPLAVYPYPRRHPGGPASRPLHRGEGAAVRRRAVRNRRSRANPYPRHPAERGGDRPADLPTAGDRPHWVGRGRCRRFSPRIRPARQPLAGTPPTLLAPTTFRSSVL